MNKQMTYEKAIELIKKNWPTHEYIMLWEALDMACEVLQERIGRDHGCEYCDGDERNLVFRKGTCAATKDEVYVSGDKIVVSYGYTAYDEVPIKFCSMCGCRLRKEGDKTELD